MRWFPAKVSGPREGSGPIGAPDSGDDVSLRGGPSPRAASSIKVGASLHLSLSLPLSRSRLTLVDIAATRLLLPELCLSRSGLALASLVDIATTRLLLPGLRLLISAHTTLTPPANLVPPTTPSTHLGLRPFSTQASSSRTRSSPALLKPETMRQLSGVALRSCLCTMSVQCLTNLPLRLLIAPCKIFNIMTE